MMMGMMGMGVGARGEGRAMASAARFGTCTTSARRPGTSRRYTGEVGIRIGVTGHQHIPVRAREHVRRGLDAFLAAYDGQGKEVVGLSSLAWGADQLFAAAMLNAGHALRAVIPSHGYESTFDRRGLTAYRTLLAGAERTAGVVTLDYPEPCEEAFFAAGKRVVDGCDLLVAFWDGSPAAGKGGTGDAVAYARAQGRPVTVIWPEGVLH